MQLIVIFGFRLLESKLLKWLLKLEVLEKLYSKNSTLEDSLVVFLKIVSGRRSIFFIDSLCIYLPFSSSNPISLFKIFNFLTSEYS